MSFCSISSVVNLMSIECQKFQKGKAKISTSTKFCSGRGRAKRDENLPFNEFSIYYIATLLTLKCRESEDKAKISITKTRFDVWPIFPNFRDRFFRLRSNLRSFSINGSAVRYYRWGIVFTFPALKG